MWSISSYRKKVINKWVKCDCFCCWPWHCRTDGPLETIRDDRAQKCSFWGRQVPESGWNYDDSTLPVLPINCCSNEEERVHPSITWKISSLSQWLWPTRLQNNMEERHMTTFVFFLLCVPLLSSRQKDRYHSINCACCNKRLAELTHC